ncbi:MAG: hypothetical protein LBH76_01810 [Propionibacteriaceae bacterium]|nr:hypothetical protein [Propionibacteriaceae bacterium]
MTGLPGPAAAASECAVCGARDGLRLAVPGVEGGAWACAECAPLIEAEARAETRRRSGDVHDRIGQMIDDGLDAVRDMARQVPWVDGCPRCYACLRQDGLRLVARGWGGVWACAGCAPSAGRGPGGGRP